MVLGETKEKVAALHDRRPNLFVIGSMKSGTTYLHFLLNQHPEIFMSRKKEPNYFLNSPLKLQHRRLSKPYGSEGRLEAYLSLFDKAGDARYRGESSTGYTKTPSFIEVSQRIAEFAPEARLLYIMRDPIERAISQYWHAVRRSGEIRTMIQAMRQNRSYINIGNYAMQLEPYLNVFDAGNVRALTFEELRADTLGALQDIWRWLGVDPDFVPRRLAGTTHSTPDVILQKRKPLDMKPLIQLNKRTLNSPQMTQVIRKANKSLTFIKKRVNRKQVDTTEAEQFLRPIMLENVEGLESLLGREFPEWRTLHAGAE